jgi:hypothetical protein
MCAWTAAWAGLGALLAALGCTAGGCGEETPPLSSYMLSGTLESTTISASGSWGYIRLVAPGGALGDPAAFLARCQFVGPACDYQNNQVLEGEYTVYGLVDLDGDADALDPRADSGDLLSAGRPLIMFDRQRLDFPDSAWRAMP